MPNSMQKNGRKRGRRKFLKTITLGAGALALPASGAHGDPSQKATVGPAPSKPPAPLPQEPIGYPRTFTGAHRKMLAFPLGGVGAGSVSLGGRGQLTEWWIFNRPDKGNSPEYAFPSIWVDSKKRKPIARVLEARIMPPYEGSSGLGSANVPGLPRLASSRFTGEFPLARIDFEDPELPVTVSLEAFTPFIPLDADESGLPVAVLRYHVANPAASKARVSIAFSIENPVGDQGRANEYRQGSGLAGLLMRNPFLAAKDPLDRVTVFMIPVRKWSDGTADSLDAH